MVFASIHDKLGFDWPFAVYFCFVVKKGDRIAQLIMERISTPPVLEVEELDDTERGAGGFGSTGRSWAYSCNRLTSVLGWQDFLIQRSWSDSFNTWSTIWTIKYKYFNLYVNIALHTVHRLEI